MHEDKPDTTPLTHDAADRSAGGGKLSADMRGALEKLFAATTELLRLEPDNLRWKKEVATLSNLLGKPDPQRTEEQRKKHDPQKAEQSRRLLEQYRALPLSERQALAEKVLGKETDEQRKKDELWKQFKAQFRQEMREKYEKPSPEAIRQVRKIRVLKMAIDLMKSRETESDKKDDE